MIFFALLKPETLQIAKPHAQYLANKNSSPASTIGHNSVLSKESIYNTNSSYDDTEVDIKIRSAFSTRNNSTDTHHSEKRNESSQSTSSVINRLRQQHEEVAEQTKQNKLTTNFSQKIIGGVKVFPSLPHPNRQAAIEARQNRLNAIEASLAELESRSHHTETKKSHLDQESAKLQAQNEYDLSINIEDCSETEHEIIDLTSKKQHTEHLHTQKMQETTTSKIVRNIPIQILSSANQHQTAQTRKLVHLDEFKSEFRDTRETKTLASEDESKNQKVNYIYYYDSDSFGGYWSILYIFCNSKFTAKTHMLKQWRYVTFGLFFNFI